MLTKHRVGAGAERNELMEDLFAAAFVAMFENDARRLRRWDGRCSRETWVSLIASSVARDQLRAERRRERRIEREADPQTLADHYEIVDDRDDAAELKRLALALETLAEPDRALLVALVLEERPPGEVAATLGVALGALYTRKSRALGKLRTAFERLDRAGDETKVGKVAARVSSNTHRLGASGPRQGVGR